MKRVNAFTAYQILGSNVSVACRWNSSEHTYIHTQKNTRFKLDCSFLALQVVFSLFLQCVCVCYYILLHRHQRRWEVAGLYEARGWTTVQPTSEALATMRYINWCFTYLLMVTRTVLFSLYETTNCRGPVAIQTPGWVTHGRSKQEPLAIAGARNFTGRMFFLSSNQPVTWSETVGLSKRPVWDQKNRSWSWCCRSGVVLWNTILSRSSS